MSDDTSLNPSRATGKNLLVVEDERIVAMDIASTLTSLGYHVTGSASSAEQAIALASERCPDLVLMDIHIKGELDGIRTAEILRRRFKVPVVYLTAYADEATVARAKATMPYGYLLKPFSDRELRSAVELALYRHEMELRLHEREHWFSTTLRSIGDAVIATDASGNVSFMNTVAESVTGVRQEDAKGRRVAEVFRIFDERSGSDPVNPIRRAINQGRVSSAPKSMMLVTPSGQTNPIEDSSAPIVDDDGNMLGAVWVFRDVSERRKAEQQIALVERLASLGTVAAGVAHEINNPLTFMMANTSFSAQELTALDNELGSTNPAIVERSKKRLVEVQTMLAELRDGCDRIRKIVADMETFSQRNDGRTGQADVRKSVEWALRMTAGEVKPRAQVELVHEGTPAVEADESKLGQVFVNLLTNAAQAIPDGARAMDHRIRVVTKTGARGEALIEIHDTGRGIALADQKRIFDPFYTTKRKGAGTGLGLSICHGIVEALGGQIEVESKVDIGSTFRVTLPAAREQTPAPERREPVSHMRGRVLVIDDEPLLARLVQRTLGAQHDVTVFTSATEALSLLQSGSTFDVIICDLAMPDKAGHELYRELLASVPDQAARTMFLSGAATPDCLDFLASVSNPQLPKPFSPDALRAMVASMLERFGPSPRMSLLR